MSSPKQSFPLIQAPAPFTVKRWRPNPVLDNPDLDIAIKTTFDNTSGLEATSPQVPDSLRGSRISSGALVVTGSLKGVATGLGTLSNVVVSIDNGSTATNMTVTATPSTITAGSFDCYVWQNSLAAATSPLLIRWVAWGTS